MANKNIFDTRNIIKATPKISNRFLLTVDSTQLEKIIFGNTGFGVETLASGGTGTVDKGAKLKQLNNRTTGSPASSGGTTFAGFENKAFLGNSGNNSGASTVLNLSLLSCTIPAFEFETAEVNRFQDSVKHITKFTAPGDMNAVFYDYINGSAASVMLAWQSMVGFKLTGEIGYKKQYTCDMDLYVYGPNRPGYTVAESQTDNPENDLLMHFKIFNAYPRSIDLGDYSYDGSEIKKATIQFGYDMIVPFRNRSRTASTSINPGFDAGLGISEKTKLDDKTSGFLNSTLSSGDDNDVIYTIYVPRR